MSRYFCLRNVNLHRCQKIKNINNFSSEGQKFWVRQEEVYRWRLYYNAFYFYTPWMGIKNLKNEATIISR